MKQKTTADRGFAIAQQEIIRRGGAKVATTKEGNRRFITYLGRNGNQYKVTTRSKAKGDWQTTINYGQKCTENPFERVFWLFVDLEFDPPKFYPVPMWWIKNDIYEDFQRLLLKHGGHRARNDNSTHHAIRLCRIEQWEAKWSEMGL